MYVKNTHPLKTMADNLETGPQYPANEGSKITGDPTSSVSGQGIIGSRATCSLGSVVSDQADCPSTATGQYSWKTRFNSVFVRDSSNRFDETKLVSVAHCKPTEKCDKNCHCCNFMDTESTTDSFVTGYSYGDCTEGLIRNCETKNVVYCVTCRVCGVQYVGETKQKLKNRMSGHKSAIRAKKTTLIGQHFADHGINAMKVRILEVVTGSNSDLLDAEDFWIRALNTAYPLGLNDRLKKLGKLTECNSCVEYKCSPFLSIRGPRRPRTRGTKKKTRRPDWMSIRRDVEEFSGENIRLVFRKLQSYRKADKNKLFVELLCGQFAIDQKVAEIISAFLFGDHLKKDYVNPDTIYVTGNYCNKGIDAIRLAHIFKDRELKQKFPQIFTNCKVLVSFSCDKPLGRKICNYGKVLSELDLVSLKNILETDCQCSQSNFVYSPAGHVITGNLDFIQNQHLKQLMQCGAKYRIPTSTCWEEVTRVSKTMWFSFVNRHHKKFGIDQAVYEAACAKYEQVVNRRIIRESTHQPQPIEAEINIPAAIENLRKLHENFIVAPADKAANNFVICCKKYYLLCICVEMGVEISQNGIEVSGNQVYKPCTESVAELFQRHKQLASFYGLKLHDRDLAIPRIFATPKLHKTPYKFQFISGARLSSCKLISQILQKVLQLFYKHFRNYAAAICNNGGPNPFWSVVDSLSVLSKVKNITCVKSISSFDFSAMFTNIPHGVLKSTLFWLTEKCFNNAGGDKWVNIGYRVAYFSSDRKAEIVLANTAVEQLISDVIDETYVAFAGLIFRQIKGVPMGGNASPTMADCSLAVLEYKYVMKNKAQWAKQNDKLVVRYMDDILTVNIDNFQAKANEIYPQQLQLEQTAEHHKEANFLDLTLKIDQNCKITTKIFDKTEAFNFEVIKYTHVSSNTPDVTAYGVFLSQLIRNARLCMLKEDFIHRTTVLFKYLQERGFNRIKLIQTICKFAEKYKTLLYRLKIVSRFDIIDIILKL